MKFDSLSLINFGPYFGEQTIDLTTSKSANLILFHGENMRGKTTLLNAVKWCLYGRVTTQVANRVLSDDGFANYAARDSGDSFEVSASLVLRSAGERLTVTRSFQCEQNPIALDSVIVTRPQRVVVHSDKRDVISADESREMLQELLPEDLAGFFFFDGESLEELQHSVSSPTGAAVLRKRIERILGMPAFTESIGVVDKIKKDVTKLGEDADKISRRNAGALKDLAEAQGKLDRERTNRLGVEEFLSVEVARTKELEPIYRASSSLIENERRYEEAKDDLEELERAIEQRTAEIREVIAKTFWVCTVPTIAERLGELETEFLESRESLVGANPVLTKTRAQGMLDSGVCDTCGHTLTEDELRNIGTSTNEAAIDLPSDESQLLMTRIRNLRSYGGGERARDRVTDLDKEIQDLIVKREYKERKVNELKEILETSGQSGNDIERQYINAKLNVEQGHDTLTKLDESIADLELKVRTFQSSIIESSEDTSLRDRGRLLREVDDLLHSGLKRFEARLREEVNAEATRMFLELTSEAKYAGLRIDQDYGLSIVDHEDRVIRKRSAGADQIVAMSLIGALSKCSVSDAPILMDSPFGRLDKTHRRNILGWLPTLAEQVVLFVTTGEFDEKVDRSEIATDIAHEYDLVQVSHVKTRVSER